MPISVHSLVNVQNHTGPASLEAAIDQWDKTELPDYGKEVALGFYDKQPLHRLVADAVEQSFDTQDEFYDQYAVMQGPAAIATLSSSLREIGKQLAADAETPQQGTQFAQAYAAVASQLADAFAGLSNITLAQHMVTEDGDFEHRILTGQRQDGSWQVLHYVNNPF